jgi:hypothetical protein
MHIINEVLLNVKVDITHKYTLCGVLVLYLYLLFLRFFSLINRPPRYMFTVLRSRKSLEFEMFLSILGHKKMASELKFFGLTFVRSRYFEFH